MNDMHNGALELGLIGNCHVAALVNTRGQLVWWCYPHLDGDPAFSRLLAGDEEKGVQTTGPPGPVLRIAGKDVLTFENRPTQSPTLHRRIQTWR